MRGEQAGLFIVARKYGRETSLTTVWRKYFSSAPRASTGVEHARRFIGEKKMSAASGSSGDLARREMGARDESMLTALLTYGDDIRRAHVL